MPWGMVAAAAVSAYAPAEHVFHWCASMGPQTAPLCNECAARWWSQYQHTPAGQTLAIEEAA